LAPAARDGGSDSSVALAAGHGLGKANDRMGWGPHVIDTKRTGGINIKGFERPLRTGLGGKI
jgi:hypothetical protein